jgi:hypothetical protein
MANDDRSGDRYSDLCNFSDRRGQQASEHSSLLKILDGSIHAQKQQTVYRESLVRARTPASIFQNVLRERTAAVC